MFQFNVPEKDISVNLENLDDERLELHIAETTIELNDQMEIIDAEFETFEQAMEVAESCELLAFSLETYGPQDATLALFNGHNDAVCSLLGIDELPTAEQWEESGYTEVAMEGAKEAVKKAWNTIIDFFKKIGSMISEMVKRTIEMVNGLEKQTKKQIERLKDIDKVVGTSFDTKISVPKAFADEGFADKSTIIANMAKQMAEMDPKEVADLVSKEELTDEDKNTIQGLEAKAKTLKDLEIGDNQKVDLKGLGITSISDAEAALSYSLDALKNLKDTQKNVDAVSKAVKKAEKDATKDAKKAEKEVEEDGSDDSNKGAKEAKEYREKQKALSTTVKGFNKYSTAVRTYARVLISAAKAIKAGKKDKE